VCEYCEAEGCDHYVGRWHNSACKCSLTGPSKCEECGHDCSPWYLGLDVPGRENLSGELMEITEDNGYPATKKDIVAYLERSSSGYQQWVSDQLPDGRYGDPGEVLLALLPPLESAGDPSKIVVGSPMKSVATGMKLVVREGEEAVLVSRRDNLACDSFSSGSHVLSAANCPLIASKSRMLAPGFERMVLAGRPVFVTLGKEMQLPFMVMGRSTAKETCGAKGTVKVSVQTPKAFAEFFSSTMKSGQDETTLSGALSDRFTTALREAMAGTSLAAMKGDHSVLAKQVVDSAGQIGLKAVVTVDYAGEPTAELAMGMMSQRMGDMSARMAMAQQAMMAAQQRRQAGPDAPPPMAPRPLQPQQGQGAQQPTGTIACAKCGSSNPTTGKFCNNCGAPLSRKCAKCGADNTSSVNFCGNCGSKL